MLIMVRDRTYGELLSSLKGRRVLIWTCSTCARLCGGIGGSEAASELGRDLVEDGAKIVGTVCSSACCMMSKAVRMARSAEEGYDLILALCCDMGARNASEAVRAEVINPVRTLGYGVLDVDGTPLLAIGAEGGRTSMEPLEKAIEHSGFHAGPYRRDN